jgi:hypothetical protein
MENQYKANLLSTPIKMNLIESNTLPILSNKIEIKKADILYQHIAIHLKTSTAKSILKWVIYEEGIQFEPESFYLEELDFCDGEEDVDWRMSFEVWIEVETVIWKSIPIPNSANPNSKKYISKKQQIITKNWELKKRSFCIHTGSIPEMRKTCGEVLLEELPDFNKHELRPYLVEDMDISCAFIKPEYIKCSCPEETTSCPCCFSVFYTNETINDMTEDDGKEYKFIPRTCGHPICDVCSDKIIEDGNGLCPICRQDLIEQQLPSVEEFFNIKYDDAQEGNPFDIKTLSILLHMPLFIEDQIDEYGVAGILHYDAEIVEDHIIILIRDNDRQRQPR